MNGLATVALALATAHRKADPSTKLIKFFPHAAQNEVRLLEVSGDAPETGEVLPFRFGASVQHNVPFPSVVVLVSPGEWERIQAGTLALPVGWDLGLAEDL